VETEDAVVWEEVFVLHDVPIRKIEEEFASISVQNRKMGVRDTFVGGGSIGLHLFWRRLIPWLLVYFDITKCANKEPRWFNLTKEKKGKGAKNTFQQVQYLF
jgi:hypothetical protein